jgi:hypothetical protein
VDELEREACAMVRQYRMLLPRAVKDFMRRLAARLEWAQLTKELG